MATFGFLVVPALTVRLVTSRMLSFSLGSSALGGLTAFAGFYCAYRYDGRCAGRDRRGQRALLVVGVAGLRRLLARQQAA